MSASWEGGRPGARFADTFQEGEAVRGVVKNVNDFGVFIDIGASRDALLPWSQVDGGGPAEGETLDLVIAKVDVDRVRITLAVPRGMGRAGAVRSQGRSRGGGSDQSNKTPVGGFVHDAVLGVRPRRKGGKGDGRGPYSYSDGLPFSDLMADDDVSGHVTNIEREGCWVDIGAHRDGFIRWENAPKSSTRWQVGDMIDDLKIVSVDGSQILLKWDDEGIGSLTEKDWEKLFAAGPPPPARLPDAGPKIGENCCALFGKEAVAGSTDGADQVDALKLDEFDAEDLGIDEDELAELLAERRKADGGAADAHHQGEEPRGPEAEEEVKDWDADGVGSHSRGGFGNSKASGKGRASRNDEETSLGKGKGRPRDAAPLGSAAYAGTGRESVGLEDKGHFREDPVGFKGKDRGFGRYNAAEARGKGQAAVGADRGKGTIRDDGSGFKDSSTGHGGSNEKGTGKGWGKGEGPAYEQRDQGSCRVAPEDRARSAPPPANRRLRPVADLAVGEIVRGRVTTLSRAGVFVEFGCEVEGIIPRALVTLQCRKGEVIPRLNITGVDASSGKVTLAPLGDDAGDADAPWPS